MRLYGDFSLPDTVPLSCCITQPEAAGFVVPVNLFVIGLPKLCPTSLKVFEAVGLPEITPANPRRVARRTSLGRKQIRHRGFLPRIVSKQIAENEIGEFSCPDARPIVIDRLCNES